MNNIRFTEYGGFVFTFPALIWFITCSFRTVLDDNTFIFLIFPAILLLICFLINILIQIIFILDFGDPQIHKGILYWLNYFSSLLFIIFCLSFYFTHYFGILSY